MMKLTTKQENETSPEIQMSLDELAREGARRMIAEALKLEADEYQENELDEGGMNSVYTGWTAAPIGYGLLRFLHPSEAFIFSP